MTEDTKVPAYGNQGLLTDLVFSAGPVPLKRADIKLTEMQQRHLGDVYYETYEKLVKSGENPAFASHMAARKQLIEFNLFPNTPAEWAPPDQRTNKIENRSSIPERLK